MKYLTNEGDPIEIQVGDEVYVDEGDSHGQIEFSGVVTGTYAKYFAVKPNDLTGVLNRRVIPPMVVDIQITRRVR